MQRQTRAIIISFIAVIILGVVVGTLPAVQDRLSWRIDQGITYARGILYPAQAMPSPLPFSPPPTAVPSPTPSSQPTPQTTGQLPTPLPTATATPIPAMVRMSPPAYETQGPNNCGPANLAMYLRMYGWNGDQNTIASVIKPITGDRNVNPEELSYYVENYSGWLRAEYRVGGDIDVLKRILAAGIPVMVEVVFQFEKPFWPNDDLWAAHYLLLTGYDDAARQFMSQDSVQGPEMPISYADLQARWQPFNYIYLVVYRPEREDELRLILGDDWDITANRQQALDMARSETEKDPNNTFAWFNYGTNLVFFERYPEAGLAYDRARTLGWPQRMLRYQFGPFIAYFHSLRTDDLLALAEYALQRTPNSEEALLWKGWGMYRQGDTSKAFNYWQEALEAHPGYSDALYAISYAQANP